MLISKCVVRSQSLDPVKEKAAVRRWYFLKFKMCSAIQGSQLSKRKDCSVEMACSQIQSM